MNVTATTGSVLGPAELIAVGVSKTGSLPAAIDEAFDGQLTAALADDKFKGTAGALTAFRSLGRVPGKWLAVVGTGSGSPEDVRRAAGAACACTNDLSTCTY